MVHKNYTTSWDACQWLGIRPTKVSMGFLGAWRLDSLQLGLYNECGGAMGDHAGLVQL